MGSLRKGTLGARRTGRVIFGTCVLVTAVAGIPPAGAQPQPGAPTASAPRPGAPPGSAQPPVLPPETLPAPPGTAPSPPGSTPESPDGTQGEEPVDPSAACRQSEPCAELGLCTASGEACVAATDADCAAAAICTTAGRCVARGEGCVVATSADCARSQACRELGACVARAGVCVVPDDAACSQSLNCRREGLCRAELGRCVARGAVDCAAADVCRDEQRCVASAGRCVKGAPRPAPKPIVEPEPQAPVGDMALEIVPQLGVGLAAEHAILGFFGQAAVGLRWREYFAIHAGLGAGSLGADRHVFLASAVPQLRPLPSDLPIDVVVGVPLGFVSYGHKDYEWVGAEAREITVGAAGFHIGGLLAVLAKASDSFAIGPALQYSRFVAERGSNFFAVTLAGAYDLWLEP